MSHTRKSLAFLRTAKGYNPDQPRGADGKFGSGGGGSSREDDGFDEPESNVEDKKLAATDPYSPDPRKSSHKDGVSDAARVGVPGRVVLPPPAVPRLPNLNDNERKMEGAFADAVEKDHVGMAKQFAAEAAKDHHVFETDAAKAMVPAWTRPDLPPDEKGKPINPERAEFRARYNTALHQSANAIAKQAFMGRLDEIAKLPESERKILVTSGGCAAGKGVALKTEPSLKEGVAATWDAAGEQNATENPWLLEECQKRGIAATFLYVHSDPMKAFEGSIERAKGIGRVVDARVFADSHAQGAKNFDAFHQAHKDEANFIFAERVGGDIKWHDGVPPEALKLNADAIYKRAMDHVESLKGALPQHIYDGVTAGKRIWK